MNPNKHTVHSIEHPLKSSFLEHVYAYVEHRDDIESLVEEYVLESEHGLSASFWDEFSNLKEVVEDFKRYIEFADECAWTYEE